MASMDREVKLTIIPVLDPDVIEAARDLLQAAEYALQCGRRLLALVDDTPVATLGGGTESPVAPAGTPGPPPVPEPQEYPARDLFRDGGEYKVAEPIPYDERPKYVPNPEPPEIHPIEVPDVPQAPDQFNPQTSN